MVVRLSALRTGRLYPKEIFMLEAEYEGFYVNEKIQIEPTTFRFVAQHLNHCATAGQCSGG